MISYKHTDVDLSHLDLKDGTYRISTPESIDSLVDSIRLVGLINPPIIFSRNKRYVTVSGFQRIIAMQRLSYSRIPTRVLAPDLSHLDRVLIAISDNAFKRELDRLEISRSLALLASGVDNMEGVCEHARTLGLPADPNYASDMIKIGQLPGYIQEGIRLNKISLKMALELGGKHTEEMNLLARFFLSCKINHNKQKEILMLLKEIAHREKSSLMAVMNSEGFEELTADKDLEAVQKTRIVRRRLHRRRFPHLASAEEAFKKSLAKLNLQPGINLTAHDYFEDPNLTLRLTFKSQEELKEHLRKMDQIQNDPDFNHLFRTNQ